MHVLVKGKTIKLTLVVLKITLIFSDSDPLFGPVEMTDTFSH